MNLVPIEPPTVRISLAGKPVKLLDSAFDFVFASQVLEIIAHGLIQALPHGAGTLPCPSRDLFVN
jgi:hypothetical protein